MMMPTIHLNGSSAAALADDLVQAHGALNEALHALELTAPNARDYYVQDVAAFGVALAEFTARVEKLRSVRDDLMAIYNDIEAQVETRNAQRRKP